MNEVIDHELEKKYHLARHLIEQGPEFLAKFLLNLEKEEARYQALEQAAREVQDIVNYYILGNSTIRKELNSDENNTLRDFAALLEGVK